MSVGYVYLIGAGPGAPDLLTLRAVRALERADVIICDKILGHGFVDYLDIDTTNKEVRWLGCAGPVAGRQEALNQEIADEALAGKIVARVKNGDPLVFGRGAEEGSFLDEHGVPWEFIPGLSSAISVCTNAGYPITNRGIGRSFAVVSARLAGGKLNLKLPEAESLVIFMGFKVMPAIREELYSRGRGPETAALVIERGTLPYEKRIQGRLDNIVDKAIAAGVSSPALFIIGCAAEECFRSPTRPLLLSPAPDHHRFRQQADVLFWPIRQQDDPVEPIVDSVLPPAEGVLFTTTEQVGDWLSQHGQQGMIGRLIASNETVQLALEQHGFDSEVWQ